MGISDDIVPVRKNKIHHLPTTVPKTIEGVKAPKKEDGAAPESEEKIDKPLSDSKDEHPAEKSKKEEIRDTFFNYQGKSGSSGDQKIKNDDEGDKPPRRGLAIWAFFIMTSILVGVLVYQNFAEIKSFLFNDKSTESSTGTSTSDTTYTDEIEPQDYTTGTSTSTTTPAANSTTTTPAATAAPSLDKTAVLVQILNGSGVSGAAEAAKKILVADGFSVKSVTNARSFAYATSIIYYKTGQDAAATAVKSALSAYQVTLENSDTIAKTYDIVVVIGKK